MSLTCWKCAAPLDAPKIFFRTVCSSCGIDQHTCRACRHYLPGKPNDCNVPFTDFVSDREKGNFCEEFDAQAKKSSPPLNEGKNKFNQLFKDNHD
jgi:hypothetical protein